MVATLAALPEERTQRVKGYQRSQVQKLMKEQENIARFSVSLLFLELIGDLACTVIGTLELVRRV
jgi:hypothetical protein